MNFAGICKLLSPKTSINFRRILLGQHLVRNTSSYHCDQSFRICYKNMSFCSWVKEEVYRDHFEPGLYVCSKCAHPLFSSLKKYNHDTPWPAFTKTIQSNSVRKRKERIYVCSECGHKLFSSVSKYEHDTPWPAFANTVSENSVSKVPEERPRTLKVSCGNCGNGLGHEFLKDGPDETSSRF